MYQHSYSFIDNEQNKAIMFIMNEQNKISRSVIKEVVIEQKAELPMLPRGVPREQLPHALKLFNTKQILIIQGVRRCGKSTLLFQIIDALNLQDFHYLNFEDERLVSFDVTMFNLLLEVLYEVNGKQTIFFFDEIQVIPDWERFVRRLHNSGNKIIITGSNASLLSQELGTKLTGRHIDMELFPFSFREYLSYHHFKYHADDFHNTEKRSELIRYFNQYLYDGGIPIYLDNPLREVLSSIYEDIIMRDVVIRYKIDHPKTFRELALYLTTNCTSSITYQKLKDYFKVGSVNTISKYIFYLENTYFLFLVNAFSASYKKQINTPKKTYIISNAFVDKIGFNISNKEGALLENLVFLHIRQHFKNIFYVKTKNNLEVDFYVYNDINEAHLIQVAWSIANTKTREREINALVSASKECSAKHYLILTLTESETIVTDDIEINVVPIYQWLLQN